MIQVVEQLVGNAKRLRQLRYPVRIGDSDASTDALCAAFIYRGKQDAIRAVRRLTAQKLAGCIR